MLDTPLKEYNVAFRRLQARIRTKPLLGEYYVAPEAEVPEDQAARMDAQEGVIAAEAVMCLGCDSDTISHFGVSTRFFGEPSARFVGEISMRFIGEVPTRFSSEVPTRFIGKVSTRFESPEQPYGPSELSLGRILGHSSNHRSKLAVLQTSLRETRNSRRLLKPRVARTSGSFLSHRESSGWTASHRTLDLAFRDRSDLAF